jgi:hypothetical protein
MAIELSLEEPRHGWVPVRLSLAAQLFEFEASDVLNNPVQELADAIRKITQGEAAEVIFWLEPATYYLQIRPTGENVETTVLSSPQFESTKRDLVASESNSAAHLLGVLTQAVERFKSLNAAEPHWPTVNFASL